MRNASGHNYWHSTFIVEFAIRQIPRSTERVPSLKSNQIYRPTLLNNVLGGLSVA